MSTSRVRRIFWATGIVAAITLAILLSIQTYKFFEIRRFAILTREAMANHRDAEARAILDRWAGIAPQSGEPEYYRAMLEVRADHPADALDAMRRAVAKGYSKEPVMVLRAILLARAGQLEEAEATLKPAFRDSVEPRAEVAEALSRIYLRNFQLSEAIPVINAWKKAAPEDPQPYLRRNEIDERINAEPAVIIANLREALRRDPNLLDARLRLAEKLQEGTLIDEAEVEYEALLKRDPKNVRGLVGAARISLLKGDLGTATQRFEAALALEPGEKTALRELGLIDLYNGKSIRAVTRLKAAAEADPFDPEVHYTYARALKIAGQAELAAQEAATTERLKAEQKHIADLRQRLVQHPDDVDTRSEVALWLIDHGHEKEGLEWTKLILQQKPGHRATCQALADYHTRRNEAGLAGYYRALSDR